MKYFFLITITFLFISCSIDPQELEKKGQFEEALGLYKELLAEDYYNQNLRVKFTLCYFKNAYKYIEQNNLDEAQRNIERGMIYNKETNPEIKDLYAHVILSLGEKYIEIGDLDGSVEQKKIFQKGYDLIEKSGFLLEDNSEPVQILKELNCKLSDKYYSKGRDQYNIWQENIKNKNALTESMKLIDNSLTFNPDNKIAIDLYNKILEKLLFESMRDQDISFRLVKIYHNTKTRLSAFKIRFYNDSSNDIILSPDQFTLYDKNDVTYKFDKDAAVAGNYKGVLNRKRLSAGRFTNGLLVFNTGQRNPIVSSLVWKNSAEKIYEKEFPDKNLLYMIEL